MTYDDFSYNEEEVDKYFDKKVKDKTRKFFAIVYEDLTIGEIQFKYMDYESRKATLSIVISKDTFKNCGIGSEAIKLMLILAKKELKFNFVLAVA
jgi:RimJ/RimL family protein N-acetyltransferase